MSLDYTIIGERLKKARIENGYTQEKLAEQLDVSIAFLSRIERGSSHINLPRLNQICSILNITEGEILSGVSEESDTYLDKEFRDLLSNCSSTQQKLIYNISKFIIENE